MRSLEGDITSGLVGTTSAIANKNVDFRDDSSNSLVDCDILACASLVGAA